jgi:hypothetical protein
VSLITVLEVQDYWFLDTQATIPKGVKDLIMPMIVIVTNIFFTSIARKQNKAIGWYKILIQVSKTNIRL